MRATMRRSVPAAATVALIVLFSLILTPTALAQAGQTNDARLRDCNNAQCIIDALLGGFVQVISSIFLGIADIGRTLFSGFATDVLAAFFGMFGAFFGGLAVSLQSLGGALFNGVGQTFTAAYAQLEKSLRFFGPLAPLLATGVVLGVIGMIGYAVIYALDRGNDPLPGFVERFVDTDDEDDEDGR